MATIKYHIVDLNLDNQLSPLQAVDSGIHYQLKPNKLQI